MTLAGPSYTVARSPGVCAATGRAFSPGEVVVAAFVERAGVRGLERRDYSLEAWEGGARPAAPLNLFGFWRTKFSAAPAPKQELLSDDELLDLFEELGAATDPKQITFRYILTLWLVRRRRLRLLSSKAGVMHVLPKGAEGEPLAVVDPGMNEAAISDAIEQLAHLTGDGHGGDGGANP